MNIWSCKAPTAVLSLALVAGCGVSLDGSFLDNLSLGKRDAALSQASMAFGTVELVAPRGFCIDKRSLKQNFAIMARCDTLGAPSAAGDAPLGIITASFAVSPEGGPLPSPSDTAVSLNLIGVSDPIETANTVTFRATTDRPIAGTGPVHWRATARIGDQIMGLALYGAENGRAVSPEGRSILSAVIAASGPGS